MHGLHGFDHEVIEDQKINKNQHLILLSAFMSEESAQGAYMYAHCCAAIGTRNVLKAAAKAGVPRLVHVSTEAVLVKGDAPISDADESTPVPDDPGFYAPYSKSKAMAERLVLVRRPHGASTVDQKQAPDLGV